MRKNILYAVVAALLLVPVIATATVHIIKDQSDFDLKLNSKQPIVFKFASDWCGVCKSVAAPFEEVSNEPEFKNILFAHVNADTLKQASKTYGIVGVPTFIYFQDGVKKDQVVGVENMENFKNDLRNHIRTTLAPELAQNIDAVASKNKALTLDEIAAGAPENMVQQPTEKPAETPAVTEVGILTHIKGFFVAVFMKIKDMFLWLIDKITFWRK